jgi:hypothetical protein
MFQVAAVKKAKKWSCKVCSTSQSVLRVYGAAERANQLRPIVQELNMKRGRFEEVRQTSSQSTGVATIADYYGGDLPPNVDWNQFVDPTIAHDDTATDDVVDGTTTMLDNTRRDARGKRRTVESERSNAKSRKQGDVSDQEDYRSDILSSSVAKQGQQGQSRQSAAVAHAASAHSWQPLIRQSNTASANANTSTTTARDDIAPTASTVVQSRSLVSNASNAQARQSLAQRPQQPMVTRSTVQSQHSKPVVRSEWSQFCDDDADNDASSHEEDADFSTLTPNEDYEVI